MKNLSSKNLSASCGCALLAFVVAAHAQGVGSSANLKGTVTDASGSVVPGAKVTAENVEKGIQRTVIADASGQYEVPALPPATYDIAVVNPGFQTEVQKGLAITVGETAVLDFHLKPASTVEVVQVTAESPVVDTERGSQADTLTENYIRDLPIDRRDYLSFSLLMPGVSNANRIADNSDFRVVQFTTSGLSFYGSNGRGNSVTVDGGSANDDDGGVLLNLSQDAVQEFQVNRSNYSADLGGASGASINIVSRSGSNQLHGSAYSFFRNAALDARDPFAFTSALQPGQFNLNSAAVPVKPPSNRQQFGATVGFPIKKDHTFLFGAYEGLRRDESASVPILTNSSILGPTAGQVNILADPALAARPAVTCFVGLSPVSGSVCARQLRNCLTVSPSPVFPANPCPIAAPANSVTGQSLSAFWENQFVSNSGIHPFSATQDLASARLDEVFNSMNEMNLRYNYGRDDESDPNLQFPRGFSAGNTVRSYDHMLAGAWFHTFSPHTTNESRAQFTYYEFNVIPSDPGGPQLEASGFGQFGRNVFLPSFQTGRHVELADNLTLVRSTHTIKLGTDIRLRNTRFSVQTYTGFRALFGALTGSNDPSPCLETPSSCGLADPPASPNALQAAALGRPALLQGSFATSPVVKGNTPYYSVYLQDSWHPWSNLTLNFGVRYEIDRRLKVVPTDYNNIAPRLAFAWDPFKDHKTVIRGGYGIFYSPIYFQIDYVAQALGVLDANRNPISSANTACSPSPFVTVTANCNRQIDIVLASGVAAATPRFQSLYQQGAIACGAPPPGSANCVTSGAAQKAGITFSNAGRDPALGVIFGAASNYHSPYAQQAELGIERQLAAGLSISASYIYAHTVKFPQAVDANLSPAPASGGLLHNWADPRCAPNAQFLSRCFVDFLTAQYNLYSSTGSALYNGGILEVNKKFDKHASLLFNYTYSKAIDDVTDFNSDYAIADQINPRADRSVSAFDQRHKLVLAGVFESPWTNRILTGFEFSPIFNYHSAHPFNLLAGFDVNGDRHSTNDRPVGAGRNTGVGPNYLSFDTRLSRTFKVREAVAVQVLAEAFNIFNRTNYASVNNVVGNISGPFHVHGSSLSPSIPLGFTSDFPKREIQLGVRLTF
jgi:hypothetical protein